MIFVILGTQDKSFERLLKKIEQEILDGTIKEKVIVQAGSTNYRSETMEIYDYLSMKEFNKYIKSSSYIITHGGVGSILDSLKNNKKVIAVPRLSKYDEHENDHQLQIVNEFADMGYIISCDDVNELDNKIKKIENFEPKKYQSNNENFIDLIENYIDNL